jgi:threonine/homoserine/homoserine lactone efflux protein
MLSQFIPAIILGLIGGLIPGPVLAATFTEILQTSFTKSFHIIFWAMLTETAIALISLVALSMFHLSTAFFYAVSFVGAAILVKIALDIWKINKIDTNEKVHFKLSTISAMILANGVLWIFWITVCVPKAVFLGQQIFGGQYLFLGLVEVGWLISTLGVAFIFSKFRVILSNPRKISVMFKIFSLAFLYFAASMLYQSANYFFDKF